MIRDYSSWSVEIKRVKFNAPDGRRLPKTAIMSYFDDTGNFIRTELLGHIPTDQIYQMIDAGERLVLDNCFVSDFSLEVYRNSREMERKTPVIIKEISAKNSFFSSRRNTDFSYAQFSDGNITFEETHFSGGRVLFNGCRFGKGEKNFSGTFFRNGHIEFNGSTFEDGDFHFKNAIINNGLKDFQDISFGNGEVSFANTEFNSGDILFINSRFKGGKFNFKVARILEGKVDFHYAAFGDGEISFERAEFGNSRIDFRAVDFGSGKLSFNRALFGNGEITFEGASAKGGKIQFKKVEMGEGRKNFSIMEMADSDVSFEKSNFGTGPIVFTGSKFKDLSLSSCHLNSYVDLRVRTCNSLDLSDTFVRDIIDMEPFAMEVDIGSMNLSGLRLVGKIYIDWKANRCQESIAGQAETDLRSKAEQFRVLKQNFFATGKYDDEDQAYVMFKRYESKAWLESKLQSKGIGRYAAVIPHSFRWLVFDAAGRYATDPIRVLLTMVVVYFFFSFVFLGLITFTSADIIASVNDSLSPVAKSFYHSAITFLTIGYGDHYPYRAARWVSGIEGFAGLFLMSYFTVAFVRKILR